MQLLIPTSSAAIVFIEGLANGELPLVRGVRVLGHYGLNAFEIFHRALAMQTEVDAVGWCK